MTEEHYEPVSCDYHDLLELAAMHKQKVELEFELEGVPQKSEGIVQDVFTENGGEFIRFGADGGENLEIRLDQIISMKDT